MHREDCLFLKLENITAFNVDIMYDVYNVCVSIMMDKS